MASFKVFDIEALGVAATPTLVSTAFQNSGGYFKAEFFLSVPDDPPYFSSKGFRFSHKTFPPGGVALDEAFMHQLAYRRAIQALLAYTRSRASKHGTDAYPSHPKVTETTREALLNCWLSGEGIDHLVQIGRETECDELRDYLEWILGLPEVEKRDL